MMNSILTILKVLRYSKLSTLGYNLSTNNTECYVLGNGPSLSDEIEKIQEVAEKTSLFVVNFFAFSEYYVKLKPKFYVLADNVFWLYLHNGKEVNKEVVKSRTELFSKILKETNWELIILLPYSGYRTNLIQKTFESNTFIKVLYFNDTPAKGFEYIVNKLYKYNLAMPHMQNVLVSCLFLSIKLGFREISIYGGDHSWTRDLVTNELNEVCTIDKHFYDADNPKLVPYKKTCGESYFMHELLFDFALMFKGYHDIKRYADSEGVKIINCTENSYIDAFERKTHFK